MKADKSELDKEQEMHQADGPGAEDISRVVVAPPLSTVTAATLFQLIQKGPERASSIGRAPPLARRRHWWTRTVVMNVVVV
jgi:hypothetical protein